MSPLDSLITHAPAAARNPVLAKPTAAHGGRSEDLATAAACFRLLRAITVNDRVMAKRWRITPQQYAAMLEIHFCEEPESLTIGSLALRLNIKHNCAVFIANKLGKLGYLARTPSQRDRRRVHLKLTARGRGLLLALAEADRRQSAAVVTSFLEPA
jgi:DNA-binding MarR family transcriptional regulator